MINFRTIKSSCHYMTASNLVTMLKKKNIVADYDVQPNGDTRWTDKLRRFFITRFLQGFAVSKFILVDVKACYEYAVEKHDDNSKIYFKSWLNKNVRYLNLDSNNRCNTLLQYFNNRFGIETGVYMLGLFNPKITKNNSLYNKLPKQMRDFLNEREISVEMITEASQEDLAELFIAINDGVPLNAAEKRHAYSTPISNDIKKLSREYEKFLSSASKWFKKDAINRRVIDDFIAGCAYVFFNDNYKKIDKNVLWEMYQPHSVACIQHDSFTRTFRKFMNILVDIHRASNKATIFSIPNVNVLFDLWILYSEKVKDRYNLLPEKKELFVQSFADTIFSLLANEEPSYTVAKSKKDARILSFDGLLSGRTSGVQNRMRLNEVKKNMKYVLNKVFVELDKRNCSDMDKVIVAHKNGWKTFEGKDIDPRKLHDGKTYHKGHIKPHSRGGKSSQQNITIQAKEDNLKNGARPLKNKKAA